MVAGLLERLGLSADTVVEISALTEDYKDKMVSVDKC